jgi:hypothetical protein
LRVKVENNLLSIINKVSQTSGLFCFPPHSIQILPNPTQMIAIWFGAAAACCAANNAVHTTARHHRSLAALSKTYQFTKTPYNNHH